MSFCETKSRAQMTSGIHLVHKPVGPTSFSLVQEFMKAANPRPGEKRVKVCHGGTLDPFAHGLLLMLVGSATRLFDHLHAIPKVYEATVRWGVETENGDLHGRVVFEGDPAGLSAEKLEAALAGFVGWHEQTPHATSAKRVGGERAYLKAHRGETVEMPPSRVYLHEAKWLSHDLPRESRLRMTVRGGYYVRALARDLGRALGCGAHLTSLHRTAIGPWEDPGRDQQVEVHGRAVMPWAPTRILTDQDVGDLRQGETIRTAEILPPEWALPAGFPDAEPPIRGFHQDRFVFLLQRQEARLGILSALPGGV